LEINTDIKDLQKKCYQLIKKNHCQNGILRIAISRGIGSEGYLPTNETKALTIIETIAEKNNIPTKIRIGISKIKTPKKSKILQNCKTMQSINYVLTKIAAAKSGNFDDVMLSEKNYIAECSSANIFWIKNNRVYTSGAACDILCGTMRQKLLSKKFTGKITIKKAKLSQLKNADEVFLSNSILLVLPVDEIIFNNNKTIKFKKNISLKILEKVKMDAKKYGSRSRLAWLSSKSPVETYSG
jgi:branched-subunit amino acid aminotransferase/4-amino-4-deoxychorismate lyase